MNKSVSAVVVGAVLIAACSSETNGTGSSSGGSACTDIAGNYTVTVERVSGTCDPSLDSKTASIGVHKTADGTWAVTLPTIQDGCPGQLDPATCKFTSACEFRSAETGAVVGNTSFTYTFTSTGYTGSTVTGLKPPIVATACDVTYRETGTKL